MSASAAPATFTGSDVDGLDALARDFTQAAQVCDEVKAACEVIVAASFVFGPFGAAFVAYLKGTVIPWLTKISEALQAMAKVLSARSQAQRDASSASTSLASYQTPTNMPTTSAAVAPSPVASIVGAVLGAALGVSTPLATTAVTALLGSGTPTAEAAEANGPESKPLAPGTLENGRSVGAVMDKDKLAELTGGPESPFHPTVPIQKSGTGFALLDEKGRYVDLALDQGKVGEATWFGVDAKGSPQVGGAVEGSFNAVDLTLHTAVPLGGESQLGLANETTLGVHGSLSAQALYNPSTDSGSASLGAEGFIGAQNTTTAELRTPYFTDRVDGTVQYGVGGAAIAKVEFEPGHVTLHLAAGVADGPGAKIANSLDVDYGRIITDVGTGVGNLERSAESALGLGAPAK